MTRWLGLLGLLLLVAACADDRGIKQNLVVVLPEAGGQVGSISVREPSGKVTVLDQPYAALQADRGALEPVAITQAQVAEIFTPALNARPIAPASFRLYFLTNSDVLTEESRRSIEEVFIDLRRRSAAEITVVGHTDTVGSLADNDALSRRRAESVRQLLLQRGLPPGQVDVAGRGERELLVPTPDQTAEPRNRRVEITVR